MEVSAANRNDATPGALFGSPIPRHPEIAGFLFMQFADQDRAKIYLPHFGPPPLQTHIIPHERFPMKRRAPL